MWFVSLRFCVPKGRDVNSKELEICTTGLEFDTERASLVRVWDNRGFTCSSRPTLRFSRNKVSSNPKKKKKLGDFTSYLNGHKLNFIR